MNQVQDIKKLEELVKLKKKEHQVKIQEMAKERYESQIKTHETTRNKLETEISKLEHREQELIARLKQTQTHHQMYVDDLDRLMNNQEPINIQLDNSQKARTPRK